MLKKMIGEALREARESRGLTVRDVAAMTGLSFPYVSDVERGDANPTLKVIEAMTKAMQIEITVRVVGPSQPLLARGLVALSALSAKSLAMEVEMLERRAAAESDK